MAEGCANPVWPCAMTGAAACLAGFSDLGVVLHGASGCYYYAEAVISGSVHCTFLTEEEIIFGTTDRLRAVVSDLAQLYRQIAVITMCVPAITGEDIADALSDRDVMVVEAPGFLGSLEDGYRIALESLKPAIDPARAAVNIDGICSTDPFARGNQMEARRLLALAGIPVGTVFSAGLLEDLAHTAPLTVHTNPDFASGLGASAGSLLGIEDLRATFSNLAARFPGAAIGAVLDEVDETEERISQICDRHLRRFDPPHVAIFTTAAYGEAVAGLLSTYLDAKVEVIAARNTPLCPSRFPRVSTMDLEEITAIVGESDPDLLIGSSYEHQLFPEIPFVGFTPPLKGRVMLHHVPLVGTEGVRYCIEQVLNAHLTGNRNTS
ncbi:MAG: nitrogenase component 1 [Methanomicrobiaceae archaeon]|nr:nitrogenase component 1 [Methanomicrobiaceae archaeon]